MSFLSESFNQVVEDRGTQTWAMEVLLIGVILVLLFTSFTFEKNGLIGGIAFPS
jgi:H+/Cl- antiporter ClcA